jgi:protein TonB
MLAYSANRPRAGNRSASPNMMLAIVGIHVAAVAVLMSAKMDLPLPITRTPLTIEIIKPKPPEPAEVPKRPSQPPPEQSLSVPEPLIPMPPLPEIVPVRDPLPPLDSVVRDPGASSGTSGSDVAKPIAATPAVLLTGAAEIKPPYPASKLASGEEADLKLRLIIDERGRVTAVEPMGRADSAFLSAARRHIIAHWRYRPATSDGRGIATTLVVTLRFRLDD